MHDELRGDGGGFAETLFDLGQVTPRDRRWRHQRDVRPGQVRLRIPDPPPPIREHRRMRLWYRNCYAHCCPVDGHPRASPCPARLGRKPTLSNTSVMVVEATSRARIAPSARILSISTGSLRYSAVRVARGSVNATTASATAAFRAPYPWPASSSTKSSIGRPVTADRMTSRFDTPGFVSGS